MTAVCRSVGRLVGRVCLLLVRSVGRSFFRELLRRVVI